MKLLSFIFSLILFSACTTTSYKVVNTYTLNQEQAVNNIDGNTYSDSLITIVFEPKETHYGFVLKNNSSKSIYILWEQSSFINNGISNAIINKDVDYYDKALPVKPSMIPPGTSREDVVIAVESVIADTYGKRLLPIQEPMRATTRDAADAIIEKGSQHGVYFTLEINGEVLTYNFLFDAKGNIVEEEIASSPSHFTNMVGTLGITVLLISLPALQFFL